MVTLHMRFEENKQLNRKEHFANRGLLLRGDEILLVYEQKRDIFVIPGGGKEIHESNDDCCVREFQEETGVVVAARKLLIRIKEYFDREIFENNYFIVEYVRDDVCHLTKDEEEIGLVPKWVKLDDAIKIFSQYNEFEDSDPIKCGLYRREHAVLSYFKTSLFTGK